MRRSRSREDEIWRKTEKEEEKDTNDDMTTNKSGFSGALYPDERFVAPRKSWQWLGYCCNN